MPHWRTGSGQKPEKLSVCKIYSTRNTWNVSVSSYEQQFKTRLQKQSEEAPTGPYVRVCRDLCGDLQAQSPQGQHALYIWQWNQCPNLTLQDVGCGLLVLLYVSNNKNKNKIISMGKFFCLLAIASKPLIHWPVVTVSIEILFSDFISISAGWRHISKIPLLNLQNKMVRITLTCWWEFTHTY